MRKKLNSGTNAILIAYLREQGGSAVVNCRGLSAQNNLAGSHIWLTANQMRRSGLLTMQKNGHGRPSLITLNEEAIRQYESGTVPMVATSSSPKTRRRQPFGGTPHEVARLLQELAKHKLRNVDPAMPLLNQASVLLSKYESLVPVIEGKQIEIAKLEEALMGLGLDEKEIRGSLNVTAEEIAGAVEYENLAAVPVVQFTELIGEPAGVFKPLAMLQVKTRVLRNLLVELAREQQRLNLLGQKLSALLKEKQEAEIAAAEVMANLRDWQRHSDRYFDKISANVAVVSSRE